MINCVDIVARNKLGCAAGEPQADEENWGRLQNFLDEVEELNEKRKKAFAALLADLEDLLRFV